MITLPMILKNVYRKIRAGLRRVFGFRVVSLDKWHDTCTQRDSLEALWRTVSEPSEELQPGVAIIVFSKDRPLQLHGLLKSFANQVQGLCKLHVLYDCTSKRIQKSYNEVFEDAGLFCPYLESIFQKRNLDNHVQELVEKIEMQRIMFLVDDIVFTNSVDLVNLCKHDSHTYIPSIRLGMNLTWCPFRKRTQRMPSFRKEDRGLISWAWGEGDAAWGYPMSLDGNIYSTVEIRNMLALCNYSTPNSLEAELVRKFSIWQRFKRGLCYPVSRIVNIPCNRVQNEFKNACGDLSAEELLELWEQGKRMDVEALSSLTTFQTHTMVNLPLV